MNLRPPYQTVSGKSCSKSIENKLLVKNRNRDSDSTVFDGDSLSDADADSMGDFSIEGED